jgi:multiple sugar transport system substrate-binding protein
MSLDPPFVPEFATAGFLAPIPQDRADEFTEGIVESAVTSATWEDELVVAPFWANTQLLWYRKSVAEAAGLDMSKPVTWDQIVKAAAAEEKTVAVQALLYEGYTVWINALVESAGASVLENPEAPPDELELGLDSAAGEEAARVIEEVTPVGGPAMSTQEEEGARRLFQGDDGGFLVNWPYVWAAWQGEVEGGTLDKTVVDDIGWTMYPEVEEGKEARPPLGGIQIGIGAFTDHEEEALDALACIVSVENQKEYMLTNGNPAAAKAVYEDPEIKKAYPMADAIVESLDAAAPRPLTPYYTEVSSSLQREFHPPSSVTTETPSSASDFILAVINGEALL